MPLLAGRLANRHELRHPCRTSITAAAERDLAKYGQGSQSALRQIVGRRDTRVVEKDEPLAGMPQQPGLQRDRLFMTHDARFESREFAA